MILSHVPRTLGGMSPHTLAGSQVHSCSCQSSPLMSIPQKPGSIRVPELSPAQCQYLQAWDTLCPPIGVYQLDSPSWNFSGFPSWLHPGYLEKQDMRCVWCSGLTDQLTQVLGAPATLTDLHKGLLLMQLPHSATPIIPILAFILVSPQETLLK